MDYKGHILFVDDEPGTTEMYSLLLRKIGYYVSPFLSAMEALSFLRFTNKKIELIIADLNMPIMDGLEFLKQVRKLPGHLTTPFIFLTAVNAKGFHIDAYQSGAIDYLQKPIDNELLLAKIEAIVHSYQWTELKSSIVLQGTHRTFGIEEVIQYCEQERVSGYALIDAGKETGVITFEKGVLKEIRVGQTTETEAFERMKSWKTYRFLIVRGVYSPHAKEYLAKLR